MKRKLLWPGILIVLIAAIVCVDVTMLIVASTTNVYQVDPAYESPPVEASTDEVDE